jgi:hypothetical protein
LVSVRGVVIPIMTVNTPRVTILDSDLNLVKDNKAGDLRGGLGALSQPYPSTRRLFLREH